MPSKVLANATLITFVDATQSVEVLPRASILITDDRVAAIAENPADLSIPSDAEIIDVEGKLVTPGFVNTHVHMWQSVFRTLGPDIILAQYFDWLSQMLSRFGVSPAPAFHLLATTHLSELRLSRLALFTVTHLDKLSIASAIQPQFNPSILPAHIPQQMSPTVAKALTPDDVYFSCLQGYLEGLHSGITSYVDHAHNNWSSEVVKPGYQAAVDSDARVWWCYDVTVDNKTFPEEKQWETFSNIAAESTPSLVQFGLSLDGVAGEFLQDTELHLNNLKEAIK
jgi:cytosine/adenosine deaminase-related metal-dependent hydrolase